jgi:plastocyanin
MRDWSGFFCATLLLAACDTETTQPPPTSVITGNADLLPAAPADLAGQPVAPEDMAVAPSGQTVNVAVGPNGTFSFAPQTVTISAGDTVLWTWMSGPHTVTSGSCSGSTCTADGQFCSVPAGTSQDPATCASTGYAQGAGATFSETFTSAGTFPYYCTVHGAIMTGMVIVQ